MALVIDSSLANIDTSDGPGFSPVDGFSSREDGHPGVQRDPQDLAVRDFHRADPAVGDGAVEALAEVLAPQAREERPQPAAVGDDADASLRMPADQPLEPAGGPLLDALEAFAAGEDERGVRAESRILPPDL